MMHKAISWLSSKVVACLSAPFSQEIVFEDSEGINATRQGMALTDTRLLAGKLQIQDLFYT